MREWKSLIVFAVLVAAAAAMGASAAPDAWYGGLQKPPFNPPNWIFAPTWTVLYAMMAVAGWRVFRVDGFGLATTLWLTQLVVNALWSPLFFGMHEIGFALIDIVVLDVLLVATLVMFFRRDRPAAWLMVPYLAWTAFATVLNAAIWILNRG